jgi:hypothetical protein
MRRPKSGCREVDGSKTSAKVDSSSNGNLSSIKSKATQKLGQARNSFNDGDLIGDSAAMKEALAGFKELKEKYSGILPACQRQDNLHVNFSQTTIEFSKF